MSAWVLREADGADAERLALIGAATFLETFAGVLDGGAIVGHCARHHTAEAYAHYLADALSNAWLVETAMGAAPIGYGLVSKANLPGSDPDGDDLELKRIYALSRFHGTGVGAALMAQAVAYAIARGAKRLLLGVYSGNERAIAFYRKSGFVQIAERRFQVGSHTYDDVVLSKTLEP